MGNNQAREIPHTRVTYPECLKVVQPGDQHEAFGCVHERVVDESGIVVIGVHIIGLGGRHGDCLMEGEGGAVVSVSINVSEHSHVECRLLLLRGQTVPCWLAKLTHTKDRGGNDYNTLEYHTHTQRANTL